MEIDSFVIRAHGLASIAPIYSRPQFGPEFIRQEVLRLRQKRQTFLGIKLPFLNNRSGRACIHAFAAFSAGLIHRIVWQKRHVRDQLAEIDKRTEFFCEEHRIFSAKADSSPQPLRRSALPYRPLFYMQTEALA